MRYSAKTSCVALLVWLVSFMDIRRDVRPGVLVKGVSYMSVYSVSHEDILVVALIIWQLPSTDRNRGKSPPVSDLVFTFDRPVILDP